MLYMIGALRVEVAPFNVDSVDEVGETDYAVKPVVGAEPPLEFVGAGAHTLNLSGKLFPFALGGLDELEQLEVMRASGLPQYVMRGDGRPIGWYAITTTSVGSRHLYRTGVGRMLTVSINMRRSGAPSAGTFFSLLRGLL